MPGEVGRVTGFEPATSSATNWRSNQLSYTRHRIVMEGPGPIRDTCLKCRAGH